MDSHSHVLQPSRCSVTITWPAKLMVKATSMQRCGDLGHFMEVVLPDLTGLFYRGAVS